MAADVVWGGGVWKFGLNSLECRETIKIKSVGINEISFMHHFAGTN